MQPSWLILLLDYLCQSYEQSSLFLHTLRESFGECLDCKWAYRRFATGLYKNVLRVDDCCSGCCLYCWYPALRFKRDHSPVIQDSLWPGLNMIFNMFGIYSSFRWSTIRNPSLQHPGSAHRRCLDAGSLHIAIHPVFFQEGSRLRL